MQFSALRYGVPGILSLLREGDATGVPGATAVTASTFCADFPSTWSGKRTLFFFDLGFAFSGEFFSLVDLGCFWATPLEGLVIGFWVAVITGMLSTSLRTVPNTRLCLETEEQKFGKQKQKILEEEKNRLPENWKFIGESFWGFGGFSVGFGFWGTRFACFWWRNRSDLLVKLKIK
jgi:hypothetical protein